MRKFFNIGLCLLVVFVQIGCRTKKVVAEAVAMTSEETDTTKFVTDSIHVGAIKTDNLTTLKYLSDWGYMEFADSGGTLTIDTEGHLKAEGVKSYHRGKQATKMWTENIAQSKDSVNTHKLQANGVQSRDNKQAYREPQEQGVKALKWYQRTIYYIGTLCCVMVIIYAIFLYLRHKI